MLNRVVLVGRLTRDPELKYTPTGVAVCKITLACQRSFTNGQGDREADFINSVVWRKQAENVATYLKKGSLCGVDGRIQSRSYDDNEGRRVFVTEVVAESVQFLETRENNGNQGNHSRNGGEQSREGNQSQRQFQKNQQQPVGAGSGGNGFNSGSNDHFGSDVFRSNSNSFNDPFANNGKPIDIADDDLPF